MIYRMGTADIDFVNSVIRHPAVYPFVSDDLTPDPEALTLNSVLECDRVYVLSPDYGGFFMYHPWNGVTYEVHSCILPECRGKEALQGAKDSLTWMFTETPCQKVVTHVPENNRLAYALAIRCGFSKEGFNRASWLKGGRLHDQAILGLTKKEFMPCPPPQS